MSDINQGGTPGVDPAALPASFFVPAQPKAEMTTVSVPEGTEIVIGAKNVDGKGISFVVAALPGSTIQTTDLANALHALSHQIGDAATKSDEAASGDSKD